MLSLDLWYGICRALFGLQSLIVCVQLITFTTQLFNSLFHLLAKCKLPITCIANTRSTSTNFVCISNDNVFAICTKTLRIGVPQIGYEFHWIFYCRNHNPFKVINLHFFCATSCFAEVYVTHCFVVRRETQPRNLFDVPRVRLHIYSLFVPPQMQREFSPAVLIICTTLIPNASQCDLPDLVLPRRCCN